MYNEEFIRKLKQTNITVNKEKTKERVRNIWKNADNNDRIAVASLANVAPVTVQRIYRTGSISAKLAIPLAQTFNVSPYYLTGESDNEGECTEELLKEFLSEHGYHDFVVEYNSSMRKKRKSVKPAKGSGLVNVVEDRKPTSDEPIGAEPITEVSESKPDAKEETSTVPIDSLDYLDSISEDDLILLMRALLLKAKSSGINAEIAKKLKLLLLGIEQ